MLVVRRLPMLSIVMWLAAAPVFSQTAEQRPSADDLDFFEKKIRPLLVERCHECHSAQAKELKGELRLDRRASVLAGGESGAVVVPGKPDESLLVQAVNYRPDGPQMPPRGKLPQGEIDLLTEWVRRGAPFPDSKGEPAAAPKKTPIDFTAGKKFWAFQPVREQPLPVVKFQSAEGTSQPDGPSRQRIDAFILAELQRKNLSPSPPADRRTLLRRLSFDLVGLPPTAEQIEAFERDTAPDAYARQVERLLASSHYGERWGRFWLDLVRYCDIPEDWAVEKNAKAWLYRDWVVKALNDDLPYGRFLELQLAADLASDTQTADIAALGFLGLSPTYWKELKLDPSVIKTVVAEEWEERIHTFGSAVLGLTVACARCHDHKQDPISQEDYYALAGVFASTRLMPRSLLPEAEARAVTEAREKIKPLQAQRDELAKKNPATPESTQQAAELAKQIEAIERGTPHFSEPLAYAAAEASLQVLPDGPDRTKLDYQAGEPQDVAVQIRGNPTNLGAIVPRRFLTVLSSDSPQPFQHGSGRLELAHALVTDAAPLTARVIVNRVWKQHFGEGLVDTPSSFGSAGSPPSHPALLNDLAARFIANGWSLKWLHREIVLSATYQQSSTYDGAKYAVDPDNRLLWRMNRRRLDVEAWRDAMLAVTGKLNPQPGGPDRNLDDAQNDRRTLYATVKRREVHAMLRLHDFPDPTTHSPGRDLTTTPLQQLFVLNSPFMMQQAEALVQRVRLEVANKLEVPKLESQVRQAYRLAYARQPSEKELRLATEFFAAAGNETAALETAWKQYALALLGANEFAFVD